MKSSGHAVSQDKRLSRRPDRVTESWMKSSGHAVSQDKRLGHVPGIAVGQRFYGRSEMSSLGLHLPPLAGIEYVSARAGVPAVRWWWFRAWWGVCVAAASGGELSSSLFSCALPSAF
jgi:hypothetical protein